MLRKHDDGSPQKKDSVVEHFGVDKPICLVENHRWEGKDDLL